MKYFANILLALAAVCTGTAQASEPVRGTQFERFRVQDSLGRTVEFYASRDTGTRPLALIIQGSGCSSVFKLNSQGQISGWHQNTLLSVARDRFRVMVVEKPGVTFLDAPAHPGTAEDCTDEFKKEHTLENWVEALNASVKYAKQNLNVDPDKVLAVGHSEGGIAVASLAAINSAVTHAAILSGSGPNQLFDIASNVRTANQNLPPDEREAAVNSIFSEYQAVLADPSNWSALLWGHPYRRWSSFLSTSTLEQLKKTSAKVFLAHGTKDTSVPVEAFDVNRAELVRLGRNVTVDRREGADHALNKQNQTGAEGMREVLTMVTDWYAGSH